MYYENYNHDKHDYAKKGTANTALGFGIAGTALGVLNAGWLGGKGLFGRGDCNDRYDGGHGGYHNNNRGCANLDDVLAIEQQFLCQQKEITNISLSLEKQIGDNALFFEKQLGQNALYQQKNTFEAELACQKRDCALAMEIACETKDLYRHTDKTAFELYKNQRDLFDKQQKEIDCLRAEVAVAKAVRPYQDKLIDEKIDKNALIANFNLQTRTCRMVCGDIVLPTTPEVTGIQGATCNAIPCTACS